MRKPRVQLKESQNWWKTFQIKILARREKGSIPLPRYWPVTLVPPKKLYQVDSSVHEICWFFFTHLLPLGLCTGHSFFLERLLPPSTYSLCICPSSSNTSNPYMMSEASYIRGASRYHLSSVQPSAFLTSFFKDTQYSLQNYTFIWFWRFLCIQWAVYSWRRGWLHHSLSTQCGACHMGTGTE